MGEEEQKQGAMRRQGLMLTHSPKAPLPSLQHVYIHPFLAVSSPAREADDLLQHIMCLECGLHLCG